MSERKKQLFYLLSLTINLILGLSIAGYFWFIRSEYTERVPTGVLFLALAYVLVEIIKKNFLSTPQLWYQSYYLGLFAIVIPLVFTEPSSALLFHLLTKWGVLLLVIPVVFALKIHIQAKQSDI